MKKLLMAATAMSMIGLAGSAMAQQVDEDTYNVNVNIEVAENVSMWAGHENVNLVLAGGPNNDAYSASSISHINNVAADISVTVNGDLPTPIVPGGGVNFFIFQNTGDTVAAKAAVTSNAYNPAGALAWKDGEEGTTRAYGSVAVATSIASQPIVYAAATPGELPLPDTFELDVVWDIAPQ